MNFLPPGTLLGNPLYVPSRTDQDNLSPLRLNDPNVIGLLPPCTLGGTDRHGVMYLLNDFIPIRGVIHVFKPKSFPIPFTSRRVGFGTIRESTLDHVVECGYVEKTTYVEYFEVYGWMALSENAQTIPDFMQEVYCVSQEARERLLLLYNPDDGYGTRRKHSVRKRLPGLDLSGLLTGTPLPQKS